MDVLFQQGIDLSDVLCKTNIDKLTLLPAGKGRHHATEMLASDAMGALLQEMAERYSDRIIIFDSPPLLAASEASVLATRMGQIVMVVEAGKTTEAAAQGSAEPHRIVPQRRPAAQQDRRRRPGLRRLRLRLRLWLWLVAEPADRSRWSACAGVPAICARLLPPRLSALLISCRLGGGTARLSRRLSLGADLHR